MKGCDHAHRGNLQDVFDRDGFYFTRQQKQDPHGGGSQQKPVPDDHSLIEIYQTSQHTGEPSQEDRNMQLNKSLSHDRKRG